MLRLFRPALVFLIALAGVAGCASPRRAASAADVAADHDVTLLRGRFVAGEQPDGNSVLLRGRDGMVVVDTGRHPRHATRIVDAARAAGVPVVAIVNTHWHLDHVAGNAALRDAYPALQVHASVAGGARRAAFLADYRQQLVALLDSRTSLASDAERAGWREELARIDAGERQLPTRPLPAGRSLALAGRRLRTGTEVDAVSGGDAWVLDVASRTLIAGDLVTLPVPLLDTACPSGWQQALARLDALEFDRVLPGHGGSMSRAQFGTWRHAFDGLLACAAGDADAAACRDGWLRDAAALIEPGDAALAASLLDHYVPSVLRSPAHRARFCRAGALR